MSVEIRVATDYLRELERNAVVVVAKLQSYNHLPGASVSGSPEVAAGYRHLSSRWDERRTELQTGLDAVIQALGTIRRAFEDQDEKLAGELTAGE